ncbi:MAG: lamin tail domain-containing protein [Deltaproteobacteria bacterium]|nr:lamin tail domain-containing protein [Deltaproteobacteria bacterium]
MKTLQRPFLSVLFLVVTALLINACSKGEQSSHIIFDDSGGSDIQAQDTTSPDAAPEDGQLADSLTPDMIATDTAPSPDGPGLDSTPAHDTTPTHDTGQPGALCGTAAVRIVEVAVGSPDYVGIKNYGTAPVAIGGFKLEMTGISVSMPDRYTFAAQTLAAGATVFAVEYTSGTLSNDVETGANIPFFDNPPTAPATTPNAVSLRDATGSLLDYWAVGAKAENLPSGTSFTPQAWPAGFSSDTTSFQRKSDIGVCPHFAVGDWGTAALSH